MRAITRNGLAIDFPSEHKVFEPQNCKIIKHIYKSLQHEDLGVDHEEWLENEANRK